MDEVTHSNKNITVFEGLNFIFEAIKDKGLDTYPDQRLAANCCKRKKSLDLRLKTTDLICRGSRTNLELFGGFEIYRYEPAYHIPVN
jgi:hypothetical protein